MENPSAFQIKKHLFSIANPEKANSLPYFFKTGVGQYGEGDQFIGVMIPQQRALVKQYGSLSLEEIQKLLKESYHECRMIGLLFLVSAFKNAKAESEKNEIFEFYIQQIQHINNWDLVDLSCPNIVGAYLLDKDRSILQEFAYTDHLWTQRIAMVSCFAFIRKNQFKDSFVIADILQWHTHDLIQKAVGWMLREVGKRNFEAECEFLLDEQRYLRMPRTMLRYAIEKFPANLRQDFLKGRL